MPDAVKTMKRYPLVLSDFEEAAMSDKPAPKAKRAQERRLAIQSEPNAAAGVYSNLMMVTHRKEEFVLDFLFVHPQRGADGAQVANLRSRVITSPEHVKRIVRALQDNISRYEAKFGPIEEATDMPKAIH
jgi:hypothetical protein